MEIQRIIKESYEQLYAYKFDNLEEMDQFFERWNLSKFTQEEIDNMNRSISTKEIASIINNLTKQKVPGLDGFTGEFYETLKEKIIPLLYIIFQKIEAEEITSYSVFEVSTNLIPKLNKDITKNLQINISHEHRCKNIQQNISKSNPTMYKKNYIP